MVKTLTTNGIHKMRVMGGKRGKKHIGRVRSCVFHPSEKRCIGFIVKRPDLLWMFHRKDVFVGLDDFDLIDGRIIVHPDASLSGPRVCEKLGIDWDACILWEGMPLVTPDETDIGYVGNVTFARRSGALRSVEASNGATSRMLLGTLEVPAELIIGFKRGVGADLSVADEGSKGAEDERTFKGAIVVSDEVWDLTPEGGWAEAAGEFTAKAGARIKDAATAAKPKVEHAAHVAGGAVEKGVHAAERQLEASKGMFSAFKSEYDKARYGEGDEEDGLAEESRAGALEESDAVDEVKQPVCVEATEAAVAAEVAEAAEAADATEAADAAAEEVEVAAAEEADETTGSDVAEADAADADVAETDIAEAEEEDAAASDGASARRDDEPSEETAFDRGVKAVGRQLEASKGMFSAFKQEFDKARNGEE